MPASDGGAGEPIWASKLGSSSPGRAAGVSRHCGPQKLDEGPLYCLEFCRRGETSTHTPLVDSRGYIYIFNTGQVTLFTPPMCVYRNELQYGEVVKEATLAATPAFVGDLLYMTFTDGSAACVEFGEAAYKTRWCKKVAAFFPPDPGCVAAADGHLVAGGLQEPPPPGATTVFTDHVFGIDCASGALKWKHRLPMPSLMFSPSIRGGVTVFTSSNGAVDCLRLSSGQGKWSVPGEMGSTSTGGAAVIGSRVYVASNRRGKRVWNAPFGGRGLVRAIDLEGGKVVWEHGFDLEANSIPACCPVGPRQQPILVVALGANPGFPEGHPGGKTLGNNWPGRIVALELGSGEQLWSFEPPVWTHQACAGLNIFSETHNVNPGPSWSNPCAGADGTVYVSWNCGGVVYALSGGDGTKISQFEVGQQLGGTPVVLPGMLVVCTQLTRWMVFRDKVPAPHTILKQLEAPLLGGSGVEHFWPCKAGNPQHLGLSKFRAPHDLSKPACVFRVPDKRLDDWFGNSPIIDAQQNVYVASNLGDIFVVRPDGSIRGSVYAGSFPSTPALDGTSLFSTNTMGFAYCWDVETLEVKWKVRYCDYNGPDNYSINVHEDILIVPGLEFLERGLRDGFENIGGGRYWNGSGVHVIYALDICDGSIRWTYKHFIWDNDMQNTCMWNFTPVTWEDRGIFMDYHLGCFCLDLKDGSELWLHRGSGLFTTGNSCGGSNGKFYCTGNRKFYLQPDGTVASTEPVKNMTSGGLGVLCCYDIMSGEKKFEVGYKEPTLDVNQGPVVVPPRVGMQGEGVVVVPFSTNLGHPDDEHTADCLRATLQGYDAETGELVWTFELPAYTHCHPGGSFRHWPGTVWPDAWGGLAADSDGVVFAHYMSGVLYALDGYSGEVISQYQTWNSSNSQICIAPGMLVTSGGQAIFIWRDPEVEEAWRADAATRGDARAAVAVPPVPPTGPVVPRVCGTHVCCHGQAEPDEEWKGPACFDEIVDREHQLFLDAWNPKLAEAVRADCEHSKKRAQEVAAAAQAVARAAAQTSAEEGAEWLVVGGADKGIVVRKGKELKSVELGRLSKGSVVEQIELQGERLNYKKLSGDGPDYGWVSLSFKGAPLLQMRWLI